MPLSKFGNINLACMEGVGVYNQSYQVCNRLSGGQIWINRLKIPWLVYKLDEIFWFNIGAAKKSPILQVKFGGCMCLLSLIINGAWLRINISFLPSYLLNRGGGRSISAIWSSKMNSACVTDSLDHRCKINRLKISLQTGWYFLFST